MLSDQLFPSCTTALATSHILSSGEKTWNVNQIYTEPQHEYFKLLEKRNVVMILHYFLFYFKVSVFEDVPTTATFFFHI